MLSSTRTVLLIAHTEFDTLAVHFEVGSKARMHGTYCSRRSVGGVYDGAFVQFVNFANIELNSVSALEFIEPHSEDSACTGKKSKKRRWMVQIFSMGQAIRRKAQQSNINRTGKGALLY